ERPDRRTADELPRSVVRPSHYRRARSRAVAGGDQGCARRSGADASGSLNEHSCAGKPASMSEAFDVVVIGAGPGGYIAAIRAAQLGFKTAFVDDWTTVDGKPAPGGTCTNVGCIPSKALLQSSENYEHAGHAFAEHGIQVKGLGLDLAQMLARKDKVVKQNNDGIVFLFRKNKIEFFHGCGSLVKGGADGWEIKVTGPGAAELAAKHVIVATGSSPRALPGADFDNKLILDNAGALVIPEVPKRLGVVGAGVVGLELGSVWRR